MKKFFRSVLVILFSLAIVTPQTAKAEIPVKARAFLTVAAYGTAGGAILGAASLAFGTSTRAIAQGASLGLYAGILFGTYVLVSHHNKRYGSYDDKSSPYGQSSDIYGDDYRDNEGGSSDGTSGSGFFEKIQSVQDRFGGKKRGSSLPPLQINLFQITF